MSHKTNSPKKEKKFLQKMIIPFIILSLFARSTLFLNTSSLVCLFLFVFVCIEWKEEKGQMKEKVFFKMISGSHGIIF
jgi:hypothetical protein